jgi:hypothetical protein
METKLKDNKSNNSVLNSKPSNAEVVKKDASNGAVRVTVPNVTDKAAVAPVPKHEPNTPVPEVLNSKPVEIVHIEQDKKAEQSKTEIKFEKPALNLESTLKLVEELHRRKIQRDKLLETINTLEAFEVAQIEDGDETEGNNFQGCVLTIEDDTRRKFVTKNPVIIQAVSQHVNSLCVNKLAEIEAGIIIPA